MAAFLEVKKPVHSSAMSTPSALCGSLDGIALGGDLDLAAADIDRVAVDLDLAGEAAVHGVEAEQVGVGLDRAEIVDRHDLDVLAARFHDGAQHVAADAAEAVDCNPNCHVFLRYLPSRARRFRDRLGRDAEMLVQVGGLGRRAEALHADERAVACRASAPSRSPMPPRRLPAPCRRRPGPAGDRLSSCAANSSHDGMDTTAAAMPSLASSSRARQRKLHFRARGDQADRRATRRRPGCRRRARRGCRRRRRAGSAGSGGSAR